MLEWHLPIDKDQAVAVSDVGASCLHQRQTRFRGPVIADRLGHLVAYILRTSTRAAVVRPRMPQYQLPIAAVLAATGVGSILVLYLSGPQQPKVQLPTSGEQDESLLHDPFDVTRPEDLVDGYPIHEQAFWDKAGIPQLVPPFLLTTFPCHRFAFGKS